MANAQIDVVSGKSVLKIIVNLISQSQANNSSNIQVIGQMINTGQASSTSPGDDIGRSVTGFTYDDMSHFGFSIDGGETFNFINKTYTVNHGSDGTLSINATVSYGNTGTTLFLSNKSVGVSGVAIPTIIPPAPSSLKVSNLTSTSLTLSWNGGAGTVSYNVDRWDNVAGTGTPTTTQVFGQTTLDVTGLTPGQSYRFQIKAVNTGGSSDYSSALTGTLTAAAGAPSAPTFTAVSATTLTVKWTKPTSNGNSTITGYRISRYDGDDTSGASVDTDTTGTGLSLAVTGLDPGGIYTFIVAAKNSATDNGGLGAFSPPSTVQLLAGAYIRDGGVWKIAIPYVRSAGVWKYAQPSIRVTNSNGSVWKLSD